MEMNTMPSNAPHRGGPRVVAIFSSLADARGAMVALERAGVEAGLIDLDGPAARLADADRARDREEGAMRHASSRMFLGLAIGAGAGLLIGAAIATMIGRGVPALVVGCVVAGVALGAFIGGIRGLGADPDWELTFADVGDRPVTLEVGGDAELRRRALDVLRVREPLTLTAVELDGGGPSSA
jgi:hypothetical protein